MKRRSFITGVMAVIGAVAVPVKWVAERVARVWIVRAGNGSIQAAINKAGPGDTIIVEPGDYPEQVTISGIDLSLVGPNEHVINPVRIRAVGQR